MKTNGKTLSCGDSQSCKECSVNQAANNDPTIQAAKFTLNGKDRCDYYDGPGRKIILIKAR